MTRLEIDLRGNDRRVTILILAHASFQNPSPGLGKMWAGHQMSVSCRGVIIGCLVESLPDNQLSSNTPKQTSGARTIGRKSL